MILALLLAASASPQPGALERLAASVSAQAVGLEPPTGLFVEGGTPLARAFSSLLASQLAGRRLAPVVIDTRDPVEAERLARERGVRSLLRLSLTLDGGRLTARGDGLSTWVNFWSGATPTRSGAAVAVVASVDADPDALTLAGAAPPPVQPPASGPIELRLAVLARLPGPPAAIATADLDGDRRAEVLVLANEELLVLSAEGKVLARADLRGAAPAAQPTRDPFGAVGVLAGPTRVVAWSARRARAEVFTWAGGLKPSTQVDVVPVEGVVLRLDPGVNRYAAEVTWAGRALSLGGPFQGVSTRGAVALVLLPDGTGAVLRGAPASRTFTGIGSGSALADVDGDGTPEVVASSARTAADGDEVRVLSLAAVEALQARGASVPEAPALWQGSTPRGRVVVAAGADLDADGSEEAVLGSWLADGSGELLVLRRAAP